MAVVFMWYIEGIMRCVLSTKEVGTSRVTLKEEEDYRRSDEPKPAAGHAYTLIMVKQLLENQEAEIIRYWGYETLTQFLNF